MRSFLAVLAAVGVAASAAAVPQTVNFQGVVQASGHAFNGSGSFKFAIVDGAGAKLWSNDGTTGAADPAAAITLPVTNSGFSVALGSTSLGMPAIAPSIFRTDARVRVWFSSNGSTYEQLTPDAPLGTAPYAAVSAIALNADNATNATNATNANTLQGRAATSFADAPFLNGFTSGLPSTYAMRVLINGAATNPAASFVEPMTVTIPYDIATGLPTGAVQYGRLILRRRVSSDLGWYNFANLGSPFSVALDLLNNGTSVCRWNFTNCLATRYAFALGDDGLPAEVMDVAPGGFDRVYHGPQSATVPGPAGQNGFTSGLIGASYRVVVDGTTYSRFVVASDAGLKRPVVSGTLGKPANEKITLRQDPTQDPVLFNTFYAAMTTGLTRHNINLSAVNKAGQIAAISLLDCAPISYVLQPADDGLPVEDIGFAPGTVSR